MIEAIMRFGSELIFIRVTGNKVEFADSSRQVSTIDGLRLSKFGVMKEFPDLENDEQWRQKAIQRFKEKLRGFANEEELIKYVMNDLKGYGYMPLYLQKQGMRRQKFVE